MGRKGALLALTTLAAAIVALGCDAGQAPATPITPGSTAAPREVNLIARDRQFIPPDVPLVPGETIVLHLVNGGLETHEAIIGDMTVQDAWEQAEAAAPAGGPPGSLPSVSVPPERAGLRIVVRSGERVDTTWTVPSNPAAADALLIGCHIPGHWARGMRTEVSLPTTARSPAS